MAFYFLPILLIILSNVFYNIAQKSTPSNVNPFVALLATYLMAALCCLVLIPFFNKGTSFLQSVKSLNWTTVVLGLSIVGLEFGYILAYRAGWNISVGSLVANIGLAVLLIPVGLLFYKEQINGNQVIGIVLCLAGLIFINRK